jgi:hypothetical protein
VILQTFARPLVGAFMAVILQMFAPGLSVSVARIRHYERTYLASGA